MEIVLLLFTLCYVLPAFIFIGYLAWLNKCSKGGQHQYKIINERFVQGRNIGFGITDSCVIKTYQCKKCGDTH